MICSRTDSASSWCRPRHCRPASCSALGRLMRKVVAWWPADQDADKQHEANEGRARVTVPEQHRPKDGDCACGEYGSGQYHGGSYRAVEQVADRAGGTAPSAGRSSSARRASLRLCGRRRRRCREVVRQVLMFGHMSSLKLSPSVCFTADARESAGQKVDKADIYARFSVSLCVKQRSAVGCV